MIDLVSKVMWRTAKHDVLDQVGKMAASCIICQKILIEENFDLVILKSVKEE